MSPDVVRLAWRSLWRHRRRTLITVLALTFSLACTELIVSLSEGVYGALVNDAVRMQAGHIVVEDPGYEREPAVDLFVRGVADRRARIAALPGVAATKVIVAGQGLARSAFGATGAAVIGVEPQGDPAASLLANKIVDGSWLSGDGAEVVIGRALADQLKLRVGRKLVLTANDAHGRLVEELCRVRGIFRTGADQVDAGVVEVPLAFARRLFGLPPDAVTQLGVVLRDPGAERRMLGTVAAAAGAGVAVLPWERVQPDLAGYILLDRASGRVLEALILLLSLFTIFNTILMSVLERSREFAVMLALGTSPGRIRAQVFLEGLGVDALGCVLGLAVGGAGGWWLKVHGLDLSRWIKGDLAIASYAISPVMRAAPTWTQLGVLGGIVFTVTAGMCLYPAWRAPRVPLAEIVRET